MLAISHTTWYLISCLILLRANHIIDCPLREHIEDFDITFMTTFDLGGSPGARLIDGSLYVSPPMSLNIYAYTPITHPPVQCSIYLRESEVKNKRSCSLDLNITNQHLLSEVLVKLNYNDIYHGQKIVYVKKMQHEPGQCLELSSFYWFIDYHGLLS